MDYNFFGKTVQLFVTSKCGMGCPRCSLKEQNYEDMELKTFTEVVDRLPEFDVDRVELFANNSLMHPEIGQFIGILNQARLKSAILTVGASRQDRAGGQFREILELIDPEKISFVFSVDHTEVEADEILLIGENHPEYPAAFKAKAFWRFQPELSARGVSFRTNTVISRHNFGEIREILSQIVSRGGIASFCHAQHTPPRFYDAFNNSGNGLEPESERSLRIVMGQADFLADCEMDRVVEGVRNVLRGSTEFFNHFRGNNYEEARFTEDELGKLQEELLTLKGYFGAAILPAEEYIKSIGEQGPGCLNLLKAGKFPQIKVGTKGQMVFCCDLHDPLTQSFRLSEMGDPEIRKSFRQTVRVNPYIWFCLMFGCNWSVNHVRYVSRQEELRL